MNNSLIAEEKVKLTGQVSALAANTLFMAYTEVNNRETLRIRHLCDKQVVDLAVTYKQPIEGIYLTDNNYLVVVSSQKEIELTRLTCQQIIQQTPIKAFQKNGLLQIYVDSNFLVAVTAQSLDLYPLNGTEKPNRQKLQLSSPILHVAAGPKHLYTYSVDGTLAQFSTQKQQRLNLLKREGILAMSAVNIGGLDHLVVVQGNKLQIIPTDQQQTERQTTFSDSFRRMIVRNNLIDIISVKETTEHHNVFGLLSTGEPKITSVQHETYERSTLGCNWFIVNINKDDIPAYVKRKGTQGKSMESQSITKDSASLLYILSAADRTRVDIFKLDHTVLQSVPLVETPSSINKEPVPMAQPKPTVAAMPPMQIAPQTPNAHVAPVPKSKKTDHSSSTNHQSTQLSKTLVQGIEKIVQDKLAPLVWKINQIEAKLQDLEMKMERSMHRQGGMQDMYMKTLQTEVLGLFETKIMPKMEDYFKNIFVEVGKVFEQGITYYNHKLNIQTDIQREAFKQFVEHTFSTTNQILELGRQQLNQSHAIQKLLDECLKKKEEIRSKTNELVQIARNGFSKMEDIVPRQPPRDPPRYEQPKKSFVRSNMSEK